LCQARANDLLLGFGENADDALDGLGGIDGV
jgi:hypothetical protein